jgi:hypothetical protein
MDLNDADKADPEAAHLLYVFRDSFLLATFVEMVMNGK